MIDILSEPVKYVARRAWTIGNRVSPSAFQISTQTPTWLSTKGFCKCGHSICKACGFANPNKSFAPTNVKYNQTSYDIKSFINCCTKNTIYYIECIGCHVQYVGCSSTELKVWIRCHLSDIENANAINVSAASRHFVFHHNRETSLFRFKGIERVTLGYRGGDICRKLLIRGAFWIFHLHSRYPDGLNVRQDLRYQFWCPTLFTLYIFFHNMSLFFNLYL